MHDNGSRLSRRQIQKRPQVKSHKGFALGLALLLHLGLAGFLWDDLVPPRHLCWKPTAWALTPLQPRAAPAPPKREQPPPETDPRVPPEPQETPLPRLRERLDPPLAAAPPPPFDNLLWPGASRQLPFNGPIHSGLRCTLPPEEEPRVLAQAPPPPAPPTSTKRQKPPVPLVAASVVPGMNPPPPYPEEAIEEGLEGEVRVRVAIDRLGKPQKVVILKSSGYPILDQSVIHTLLQEWRFSPATRNGQPLPATWEKSFIFRLESP